MTGKTSADNPSPRRLLIVVNEDRFFLSHRKEVARAALQAGWDVTVVAGSTGLDDRVRELGVTFLKMPILPTGINLIDEARLLRFLVRLYRSDHDVIIHHVGMKLILVGNLALRIAGNVRGVLNAVSGLGIFFLNPKGIRQRFLLNVLHWLRPKSPNITLFQNDEDLKILTDAGFASPENSLLIKGSGIELDKYQSSPIPAGLPKKIIFTGRLLRSKGIVDLIEAAMLLRSKWEGKAQFLICGPLSRNKDGVSRKYIENMADGHYIKWLGNRDDIPHLLEQSSIMAFPSYYREGVPRSLLEASAAGRPIVTTDSVGCRDTVIDGRNGFLIPPRNPGALADRLDQLLSDDSLCRKMGRESRRIAERDYDLRQVCQSHLKIYEKLYQEGRR